MGKLAMLMMIPALPMFMMPAMATANRYDWWGIQGTWKMSASGSCLHSSAAYSPTTAGGWTAPGDSNVYVGVTVSNGTWTFESTGWLTGTGTYSQRIYTTISSRGPLLTGDLEGIQWATPFTFVRCNTVDQQPGPAGRDVAPRDGQ